MARPKSKRGRRKNVSCNSCREVGARCAPSRLTCTYYHNKDPQPQNSQTRKRKRKLKGARDGPLRGIGSQRIALEPPAPIEDESEAEDSTYADRTIRGASRFSDRITVSVNDALSDDICIDAISIQRRLEDAVQWHQHGARIEDHALACLKHYMAYLFPNVPLLGERSFSHGLKLVGNLYYQCQWQLLQADEFHFSRPSVTPRSDRCNFRLKDISEFCLITAMCAAVHYLTPECLALPGHEMAPAFLRASRRMLDLISDLDLKTPTSNSLVTRYLHSLCLRSFGEETLSWHALGEAIRIAQAMRLFDEDSYDGLPEYEAAIRRRVFWQLFTDDRSGALLESRPSAMDMLTTKPRLTVAALDLEHEPTLTYHAFSAIRTPGLEKQLREGFNLRQTLFGIAMNLVEELRLAGRYYGDFVEIIWSKIPGRPRRRITDLYLRFTLALDKASHAFQFVGEVDTTPEGPLMVQTMVVNLWITYHCLHNVILSRYAEADAVSVLGLSGEHFAVDSKRYAVGHDLVQVLRNAPNDALLLNGSTCAAMIKEVAASLLDVSTATDNALLADQAKIDHDALYVVLSRLVPRTVP
ncbi:hypothetical protein BDZ85DRAFT_323059 [Elsinoe ampelina]|uniref:Xylanolytic transcriptional activator regulatory domain-containing protein n=1 Tax=Elsinoe ampelina TaxID=302913 RepID=A0A6A6FYL7_9PEZI|nr:hypothetical protein BDZ85DRAFT_323059 [Elsinoe ampelina]